MNSFISRLRSRLGWQSGDSGTQTQDEQIPAVDQPTLSESLEDHLAAEPGKILHHGKHKLGAGRWAYPGLADKVRSGDIIEMQQYRAHLSQIGQPVIDQVKVYDVENNNARVRIPASATQRLGIRPGDEFYLVIDQVDHNGAGEADW